MPRKLATDLTIESCDFVRHEIVEGHFIHLDKTDIASVAARRWYLSFEKKCNSTYFITNINIGHRRYQKVTLQTFLTGVIPGMIAKLINQNSPFDYRRSNLMIVNSREQSQALGKRKGLCSSIYKGVSYRKERDKWAAMIKCPNGKQKLVGYFDSENDAGLAYNKAARDLFGNHAYQNEVECRRDSIKEHRIMSNGRYHKPRSVKGQR